MFCKFCGKQLPDGSTFCQFCGKPLASDPQPASNPQPQRPAYTPTPTPAPRGNTAGYAAVALALVVFASAVLFALSRFEVIDWFEGAESSESGEAREEEEGAEASEESEADEEPEAPAVDGAAGELIGAWIEEGYYTGEAGDFSPGALDFMLFSSDGVVYYLNSTPEEYMAAGMDFLDSARRSRYQVKGNTIFYNEDDIYMGDYVAPDGLVPMFDFETEDGNLILTYLDPRGTYTVDIVMTYLPYMGEIPGGVPVGGAEGNGGFDAPEDEDRDGGGRGEESRGGGPGGRGGNAAVGKWTLGEMAMDGLTLTAEEVEQIAGQPLEVSFEFFEDGTFFGNVEELGVGNREGTYEVDGDQVIATVDGDSQTIMIDGNRMTIDEQGLQIVLYREGTGPEAEENPLFDYSGGTDSVVGTWVLYGGIAKGVSFTKEEIESMMGVPVDFELELTDDGRAFGNMKWKGVLDKEGDYFVDGNLVTVLSASEYGNLYLTYEGGRLVFDLPEYGQIVMIRAE